MKTKKTEISIIDIENLKRRIFNILTDIDIKKVFKLIKGLILKNGAEVDWLAFKDEHHKNNMSYDNNANEIIVIINDERINLLINSELTMFEKNKGDYWTYKDGVFI